MDPKEYNEWMRKVVRVVTSRMYKSFEKLKETFNQFDSNKDGKVSVEELAEGIKKLDLGLTENQIYDFICSSDENQDGEISYKEFSERFGVHFNQQFCSESLKKIFAKLSEKFLDLKSIFKNLDKNKDGKIDFNEFQSSLVNCGFKFDSNQSKELFQFIDSNKKGFITYDALKSSFSVVDSNEDIWASQIFSSIRTILLSSKFQLERIFHLLDSGLFLNFFL